MKREILRTGWNKGNILRNIRIQNTLWNIPCVRAILLIKMSKQIFRFKYEYSSTINVCLLSTNII